MAIHAHPDDESSQTGGTLARYAAAGYRVILVTCTDGGQGDGFGGVKPGQPGHVPRAVAQQRSGELDLAAAHLGITEVVKLGYPDSGMADDAAPSRPAFSQLPVKPLVGEVVRLMRLFRPDVVLTYPPNGLSQHPDHIRTHDIVVAAHGNIVASADWGSPDAPGPRLYYVAVSQSQVDQILHAMRADGQAWAPPADLAVDDATITTVIDVAEFWDRKLRALAAHASQADAAALQRMFSSLEGAVAGARTEEYVRAYPAPAQPGANVIERDFFSSATEVD